jgi:hypothetical protein
VFAAANNKTENRSDMKNLLDTCTEPRHARRLAALCGITLLLVSSPAQAVIIKGSGDPAANTAPPAGALADSGWQHQGLWGGVLGTPIAPQYFIAARHVGGSVGQEFIHQGVTYRTTAFWNDPNSDLRIWKVDGIFPGYAPLYSLQDEAGKPFVVMGRGTQRGAEIVVSVVQTNYYTNVVSLKELGIKRNDAQQEFPEATFHGQTMTVVSSEVVTNDVTKGWKFGKGDGVMRWGENTVVGVGSFLVGSFDANGGPNEAYLSGGDSSGAVFIQEGGVWKLAGINYGIEGPFGTTPDESFYAAIMDKSGLYCSGILMPEDGQLRPAYFYVTRISTRLSWIYSIIGQ